MTCGIYTITAPSGNRYVGSAGIKYQPKLAQK